MGVCNGMQRSSLPAPTQIRGPSSKSKLGTQVVGSRVTPRTDIRFSMSEMSGPACEV